MALLLAMTGIAIYIWFRFEWQFGVGALISLVHDLTITLGFFALTQIEFDLNVIAALLTLIGYSLNDTVVVYDRIRENLRKYRKMEIEPLLNLSVNETLARTVATNGAVLLAVIGLVVIGPATIYGLTMGILFGVIIGTYSSILRRAICACPAGRQRRQLRSGRRRFGQGGTDRRRFRRALLRLNFRVSNFARSSRSSKKRFEKTPPVAAHFLPMKRR